MSNAALPDGIVVFVPDGDVLEEDMRRRLLACGKRLVPPLVKLIASFRSASEFGRARSHAASLLADLGAVEAIPCMLEAVCDADCPPMLAFDLRAVLVRFGIAVIRPACKALERAPDLHARWQLCSVLVRSGTKSRTVRRALLRAFAEDRGVASALAAYGDRSVLPTICDAIATFMPDEASDEQLEAAHALICAYEDLGGDMTENLCALRVLWTLGAHAAACARGRAMMHDIDPSLEDVRAHLPSLRTVAAAQPLIQGEMTCGEMARTVSLAEALKEVARLPKTKRRRGLKAALGKAHELTYMRERAREVIALWEEHDLDERPRRLRLVTR